MTARISARIALATLCVMTIVLAGCARTPTPPPTVAPATTTPTASPETTPPGMPSIAFDGDCTRLLPSAEIESLVGQSAEPDEDARGALPGIASLGGLECGWGGVAGLESFRVAVLPLDRVAESLRAEVSEPTCAESMGITCMLGAAAGDLWVLVTTAAGADTPAAHELLAPTLAAVSARVGDNAAARTLVADTSWWALPSCETMADRIDVVSLLGPEYTIGALDGRPEETWMARELEDAGVEATCRFRTDALPGDTKAFSVTLYPGGAWSSLELVPSEAAITVPGAIAAGVEDATMPGGPQTFRAAATDGVNVATVIVSGSSDTAGGILARVFAAMADTAS